MNCDDCCKMYDRRAIREANRVFQRREYEPMSLVTIITIFGVVVTIIALITS